MLITSVMKFLAALTNRFTRTYTVQLRVLKNLRTQQEFPSKILNSAYSITLLLETLEISIRLELIFAEMCIRAVLNINGVVVISCAHNNWPNELPGLCQICRFFDTKYTDSID